MKMLTKVLGAAGVVGGVAGAAALGGVTAQRLGLRRFRTGTVGPAEESYDALDADRAYSVVAPDGVVLHVEEVGPVNAPLTVVFAHGWALRMGSWHYQRVGLAPAGFGARNSAGRLIGRGPQARLVFYDQRSHGRSTRASTPHPTIAQLAQDLATVLATAAPTGPVVIVGHSMGGMAALALAGADPDYFAERVAGVGLLSTSSTQLPKAEIGRLFFSHGNPVVKAASTVAVRYARIIERSRASTRDAVWLATRILGFARKDVPASLVDYLNEMLTDTPIDVIADFVPGVLGHDQTDSLPALAGIPTLILCGDADRITPPAQSRYMAQSLPEAQLVLVERAAHLAMMEAPDETNEALRDLLRRSVSYAKRLTTAVPDSA